MGEAPEVHRQLLSILNDLAYPPEAEVGDFAARRVDGGANNILYRVTGRGRDWAYKFCTRDARQRAWREYLALCAIDRAGLAVAPKPVLLDQASWSLDVVVQTWLDGEVSDAPPTTDAEWQELVTLYNRVHTLTCSDRNLPVPPAVQSASTAEDCVRLVQEQLVLLPDTARPEALTRLVMRLEGTRFASWPQPAQVLCHIDSNTTNLIRRPEGWCAVDWENAGRSDPALDMAELITHAAYTDVGLERWQWLTAAYSREAGDRYMALRIHTYWRILAVWWVARMARYLYEVPRGQDERLVKRSHGWLDGARHKLAHYIELADSIL